MNRFSVQTLMKVYIADFLSFMQKPSTISCVVVTFPTKLMDECLLMAWYYVALKKNWKDRIIL